MKDAGALRRALARYLSREARWQQPDAHYVQLVSMPARAALANATHAPLIHTVRVLAHLSALLVLRNLMLV